MSLKEYAAVIMWCCVVFLVDFVLLPGLNYLLSSLCCVHTVLCPSVSVIAVSVHFLSVYRNVIIALFRNTFCFELLSQTSRLYTESHNMSCKQPNLTHTYTHTYTHTHTHTHNHTHTHTHTITHTYPHTYTQSHIHTHTHTHTNTHHIHTKYQVNFLSMIM